MTVQFTSFGSVTTDTLYSEPWERWMFGFYERNKERYRKVADIGANVGVHTLKMREQGWAVKAYEPDPIHFISLVGNTKGCGVDLIQAAVSDHSGRDGFVRVERNTTENHLARDGETPTCSVAVLDCRPIFEWADLVKMDCEGAEADIICATNRETWDTTEAAVEIGGYENARRIFYHLQGLGVPVRSEKTGWEPATTVESLPMCCQDGMAFIGFRNPCS